MTKSGFKNTAYVFDEEEHIPNILTSYMEEGDREFYNQCDILYKEEEYIKKQNNLT